MTKADEADFTPPWIRSLREITPDEARAMFPSDRTGACTRTRSTSTRECTAGCGELHLHCEDCGAVVSVDERRACTSGCSQVYARCPACADDHWETHHQRAEANRPSWERVP